MFLAEIGKRDDIKSWQIQQAADAVRIYRYQYRGAKDDGEGGIPTTGLNDDAAILVRLRQVIRLRHYAKSTEKTYLHWSGRFLELPPVAVTFNCSLSQRVKTKQNPYCPTLEPSEHQSPHATKQVSLTSPGC